MIEIWKPIKNYEKLYEVSNLGRVKSLERVKNNNGGIEIVKERILKQDVNQYRNNYHSVHLSNNGVCKTYKLHQLVAFAFPEICGEWFEGCEIDHLDCNPHNNVATNLRVTDKKGNMNNPLTKLTLSKAHTPERKLRNSIRMKINNPSYNKESWTNERRKQIGIRNLKKRKPIAQYSLEGKIIKKWNCITDIKNELGYSITAIRNCCLGKQAISHNCIWKYV